MKAIDTLIDRIVIRKCIGEDVKINPQLRKVLSLQAEFAWNTSRQETLRAVGELLEKRWYADQDIFLSIKDIDSLKSGQMPCDKAQGKPEK